MPTALKRALASSVFASGANVTMPGPLVCDQVQVTTPGGVGSPSSVTLPLVPVH